MNEPKKLSTEAYKGVRDFYPEDMFIQKHIFATMQKAVEKFGYVEYGASVLEPAELYKAKSGEEIVNEQTYTFKDRGDREVTLRPEMTPTVARMVAAHKRELAFPLRWYSIPNLFRYEQPQRGRVREHWQLNVDLFGIESIEADVEVIAVAANVMKEFGAQKSDFGIQVNNRKLWNLICNFWGLTAEQQHKLSKLVDRKNKLPAEVFTSEATTIIGDKAPVFFSYINKENLNFADNRELLAAYTQVDILIESLKNRGIENVTFDPTLMRGFDYYTGTIFEVFDTNPENRRALFGGGRYDDLASLFGGDKIPAIGFGMGDVGIRNFLETRGLLPVYTPSALVYIALHDESLFAEANTLADTLRVNNINVAVNLSSKKLGDQIKIADKQKIPYILVIGQEEVQNKVYKLKNLASGEEQTLSERELVAYLQKGLPRA
jgi:histidyl-tRNA synthetase